MDHPQDEDLVINERLHLHKDIRQKVKRVRRRVKEKLMNGLQTTMEKLGEKRSL